jgi:hypothetical protein
VILDEIGGADLKEPHHWSAGSKGHVRRLVLTISQLDGAVVSSKAFLMTRLVDSAFRGTLSVFEPEKHLLASLGIYTLHSGECFALARAASMIYQTLNTAYGEGRAGVYTCRSYRIIKSLSRTPREVF